MVPTVVALVAMATPASDLVVLRSIAQEVLEGSRVRAGASIPGGARNTTGHDLRVPGANLAYYPAFWIRDAAMMLGGDFVPAAEVEGWIRVVAATQPAEEIRFGPLRVPPYSVPDHITVAGEACWYPGAYTEQGTGAFGILPPADDAFFFIQMVFEHARLTGSPGLMRRHVGTAYGVVPLADVAIRSFDSVAADPDTGLVVVDPSDDAWRIDWGFCDTVRKSGPCLMPSLLRWQAAMRLADLLPRVGRHGEGRRMAAEAAKIRRALAPTFLRETGPGRAMLLSATGLGRKDDVWASSFAVWLGVLGPAIAARVSDGLAELVRAGGIVHEGQVRHIPTEGEFGGHWDRAISGPDTYQNGGYWATPTGWLVAALRSSDRRLADRVLSDFVAHTEAHRAEGAPWEWIGRSGATANERYAASAGLVHIALSRPSMTSLPGG